MAIPKARKTKGGSQINNIRAKAFEEARWYVAKTVFPNFATFVFKAVLDELDGNKMKNFHLTEGEKRRLMKSIAQRTERYCNYGRTGAINPYEVRELFEKDMGINMTDLFI